MSDRFYWRLTGLALVAAGASFAGPFLPPPWHMLANAIGMGLLGFIVGICVAIRSVVTTVVMYLKPEAALGEGHAVWLPTHSVERVYKMLEDVPETGTVDGGPGVGEPDRP